MNLQFEIDHLKTTLLDLLNDDRRDLVWSLIEHYYKKSTRLEHFDALGFISLKSEKRDTYLKCAEAVYSLSETPEQKYLSRANLYKAYNALNRPEEALFYINQNLEITPNDFETLCHKSFNMALMGNKSEADLLMEEIQKAFPNKHSELKTSLYRKLLTSGNTAQGILKFLNSDEKKSSLFDEKLGMKRWMGIIHPGKTIYVQVEGGIGDLIINIRFFDMIKSLGMKAILVSENNKFYKDINSVFSRHGYEVITEDFLIDRKQYWCFMMSLPGLLNCTEFNLWKGSYLKPLKLPKNILHGNKPKIGIKCNGNPFFGQDEYRKIDSEVMKKYLPKDCDIYYIDKLKGPDWVINLNERIESWEDTLDFISQMDCIVSSCTSLVHAAGAMSVPTFVAVPIAEYYIWTNSRTDTLSPWYSNSFSVHKQTELRSWDKPLKEINDKLKNIIGKK
jgi:tetratricopeptide (TPR) repeat protein